MPLGIAGFVWPAAVAGADAATGRHAILIVLLGAGPCFVVLTERPGLTVVAGLLAVVSAIVCGAPDGIFGTGEHLLLIISIVAVAGVALAALTSSEAFEGRNRGHRR